MTTKMSQHRA